MYHAVAADTTSADEPVSKDGVPFLASLIPMRNDTPGHDEAAWLRACLEAIPDCVKILDQEGCIQFINRKGALALGVPPKKIGSDADPLLGLRWSSLCCGASHTLIEEAVAAARGGTASRFQGECATLTGDVRLWDVSVIPLQVPFSFNHDVSDTTQLPAAILAVAHDITSLKIVTEALRASEERFALAVAGTRDGIWDWNLLTDEVYFSPRWKEQIGYVTPEAQASILPHPSEWAERVHPDDREQTHRAVRDHLEGRTNEYVTEFRFRHQDGSWRWMTARGRALRRADGVPHRFTGAQTDITERKEAETQRERIATRDAKLARTLENALLPSVSCHAVPGWHICAVVEPLLKEEAAVGGDFYDVFPLTGDRWALVVGDVMGKGLAAALSIAEVRFALRGFLREGDGDPGPALARLNRFLLLSSQLEERPRNTLVSVAVTVVHAPTGQAWLAAAGAEAALLVQNDRAESIDASDLILGISDQADYRSVSVSMERGGTLLLPTDGIIEARRRADKMLFGTERFAETAVTALPVSPFEPFDAPYIGRDIVRRVHSWTDSGFTDDVCLLIAHRGA